MTCAKTGRILLLTIVVALGAGHAAALTPEGFRTTWESARRAAEAAGKPILLHFTTDSCPWCRRMESDVYPTPTVAQALGDFVAASLDCSPMAPGSEANGRLLDRFGGEGVPHLVMLTSDQVVLGVIRGYVPPERLAAELAAAKVLYQDWDALQAELAAAGRAAEADYALQLKAMRVYDRLGQPDKATGAANQLRRLDPDNARGDWAETGWVMLRAAAAQSSQTHPSAEAQGALLNRFDGEIRRYDPRNEKGFLAKLLVEQVTWGLSNAMNARGLDDPTRGRMLDEVMPRLTELTELDRTAPNLQVMWAYAGNLQTALGRLNEGQAALSRAVALDPESELAPRIKEALSQIGEKLRRQQAPSTPPSGASSGSEAS